LNKRRTKGAKKRNFSFQKGRRVIEALKKALLSLRCLGLTWCRKVSGFCLRVTFFFVPRCPAFLCSVFVTSCEKGSAASGLFEVFHPGFPRALPWADEFQPFGLNGHSRPDRAPSSRFNFHVSRASTFHFPHRLRSPYASRITDLRKRPLASRSMFTSHDLRFTLGTTFHAVASLSSSNLLPTSLPLRITHHGLRISRISRPSSSLHFAQRYKPIKPRG
jgi:hypothetical protein